MHASSVSLRSMVRARNWTVIKLNIQKYPLFIVFLLLFRRTTLARWRAAQVKEHGGKEERRPYLATECTNLKEAEKWRVQIIREISKKVAQIQNGKQIAITNYLYINIFSTF